MKEFAFLGHPDKQADLIADLLVDRALAIDPNARCAYEVMVKGVGPTLVVVVGGEGMAVDDEAIEAAARDAARLGQCPQPQCLQVVNLVTPQSPDIRRNATHGVGDQSIVVGMAVSVDHPLANARRQELALFDALRESPGWDGDGKALFDEQGQLVSLSVGGLDFEPGARLLEMIDAKAINPPDRGRWAGGPLNDCGMTNRKLACDSHGTFAPHGGGGLSGKDLSKPDRGGRLIADALAEAIRRRKDLFAVAVQMAYVMGRATPLSLYTRQTDGQGAPLDVMLPVGDDFPTYTELLAEAGAGSWRASDHCHPWVRLARTR